MITNIFDTHAHYDDERFSEDMDSVLKSLPQAGIAKVLNAGCDMKSSRVGISLGEGYDFLYSSVGVHPHSATEINPETLRELQSLANAPKVCAIGEIGLDYYYDLSPRDVQRSAFEQQLALARELDMPVIIHSRDAAGDTMEILKKYRPRGIVHCFSGSLEMAKEILKLDMLLGFTGVITFKNARRAVEVVEYTPADYLLTETDSPYMAPEPFRGQRTNSAMLQQIVQKMAEIKHMNPQEFAEQTMANACRIYGIK